MTPLMITPEMIREAVDAFVDKYNKKQVVEACELYSPFAILLDKGPPIMGRTRIIEFLTSNPVDGSITNHHVDMVNVSCDGQRAMAFVQFTIGYKYKERSGDSYVFPQSCCSMMFELDNNKLYVTSSMSLARTEC